ncbi:hypothetical protein KSX_43080 [Ktedonospora formicarum]|uniref:Uncharacterized protein n=1 Tax=Ktedonospora formicarum TaxID=2778364 RepID=A0A8J3MV57_9CHLR|nr:hypothetical protein KSX_43080 [Ktedonospora formicarum]
MEIDESGCIPAVDQIVYWSHPRTRQFLQDYPRAKSLPGQLIERNGEPAIAFQILHQESSAQLTIVAHRQTLRVLAISHNG